VTSTPTIEQVPVAIFPTIGINRPGTDRWPILMTELDEICRWVRAQAVPRLITGTEPPEPGLPARYEISTGHEDERRAMAAGTSTTAAQRHQQRLSAAVVRIDLVDPIDQMDGSPGPDQISTWLAHLSDADVLERMSQLKATDSYDPNVILHNLEDPHALRHTAASLAIASGANVKVVQQMLGHKSATMTLDLYGHLFPDQLDQVAEHLDADARAAVYPLCTRAEVVPAANEPENAESPLQSKGLSRVAPTGFEPALTP
jgi:Phage integrase family